MSAKVALCYHRKSRARAGMVAPASPEMQRANTNTMAASLNLQAENYTDAEGHTSGKTEEGRPEWLKLRARLGAGDVAVLIVNTWDRAARNVRLLLELVDECETLGVRFIACQDNIDTRTAAGRFQLTVLAGVAEYESNVTSERRVATVDHLRRVRGRHFGTTPFGAVRIPRDHDRVLVPSDRAQPNGTDHAALARCYALWLEKAGGIYAVAAQLNAEGWRFRNRHGELEAWDADDVRRVLYNHWLYAGFVVVGRAYRGNYEVIPGSHAPLLDPALTDAVAARLGIRKRMWKRQAPMLHPLTGVLYCAECGERLGSITQPSGQSFYRHFLHDCGLTWGWRCGLVEDAVLERVAGLKVPRERIVKENLLAAQLQDVSAKPDNGRIAGALERLKELYVEGELSRADYDRRKAEYEAQQVKTEQNLQGAGALVAASIANVRETNPATFRDLVRMLYEKITIASVSEIAYQAREWCREWA